MTTEKVSFEQAQQEVNDFLDLKNISPRKKEKLTAQVDELIEAVMYGHVTIDGESIKQTLQDPLLSNDGTVALAELSFNSRITVGELNKRMSAMPKGTGPAGYAAAGVAAYASLPSVAMVEKLQIRDYGITQTIISFF
jgi:hypothetical protein